MPSVELTDIGGTPVDTREIINGKTTIFLFLAIGCDACEKAIKDGKTFVDQLPPDVQVIGICNQNYEKAQIYKSETGFPFQLYCDTNSVFREQYRIDVYPSMVGFTRQGRVALVRHGYSPDFTLLDAWELTEQFTIK